MKLIKLEITNFSSYYSSNIFLFDEGLNIIQGHNGAGKTSLLEALFWAILGCKMFDSNHITRKYTEFIKSKFNYNSSDKFMSVYFEMVIDNEIYDVTRKITFIEDKFVEEFKCMKDKEVINKINKLDTYTKSMLSSFIFDGETINSVINNNNMNDFVFEMINNQFNLNIISKLKDDLNKVGIKSEQNIQTKVEIKARKKYIEVKRNIIELQKKIENINSEISLNKQRFFDVVESKKKYGVLSDNEESKLILNTEFLINENENIKKKFRKNLIENGHMLLLKDLNVEISNELFETRKQRVLNIDKYFNDENVQMILNFEVERDVLNFSKLDSSKLISQASICKLNEVKITNNKSLLKKSDQYSSYIYDLECYDIVKDLIMNLEEELNVLSDELKSANILFEKLTDEIDVIDSKLRETLKVDNAILMLDKLKSVVSDYEIIKINKVFLNIENEIKNVLGKIYQKKNLITSVKIDVNELVFLNDEYKQVDIKLISNGEKQILIVSILFAILKCSDKEFVLVLDTFFARLDKVHSVNICKYINEYYKNQVIFLTTDKELTIDEARNLNIINKNVYQLNNDGLKTEIKEVKYEV